MKFLLIGFFALLISCDQSFPNSGNPLVVLTFDDNNCTIYNTAYPLIQEFGFVGTCVTCSGRCDQPGYITWQQLSELSNAGWEIAGHTVNHVILNSITPEEAEMEIYNDLLALRAQGFEPVTFALPKGKVSADILEIIPHYYRYIRHSLDTINFFPVDVKAIGYYPMQSFYSENEVITRLQLATWRGECLIVIGFHNFCMEDGCMPDNCKPSEFREILQYIKDQNLEVVTLAQALERCGN
ncbi:MAG: polysaccharide deacetylase family protein [Candidatus Cloacimonetes bacterium]|nr:polysaccharide deacetylase family protein [Candidatus Cloacimonadota bacterium]